MVESAPHLSHIFILFGTGGDGGITSSLKILILSTSLFSFFLAQGVQTFVPLAIFNLVSNIGFGLDATHTTDSTSPSSGKQTQSMTQIIHPDEVKVDIAADDYAFMNALGGKNLYLKARIIRKIKSYFSKIFPGSIIF